MRLQQPYDQLISRSPRFEKYLLSAILLVLFSTCLILPWLGASLIQSVLIILVNLLTASLVYFFTFVQADKVFASPNLIKVQRGNLLDSIPLENVIYASINDRAPGFKYAVLKLREKSALGHRVVFSLPHDYSKEKWSESQVTQRILFLARK